MTTTWDDYRYDPRTPAYAGLRASDADRDLARATLATAYGEGRLTHAEHTERTEALLAPLTLGELLTLLADLVPATTPTAAHPPAHDPALAAWRRRLGRDLASFVVPTLICILLWLFATPHLFWPIWVMVYTGIAPLRTLTRRPRPASAKVPHL